MFRRIFRDYSPAVTPKSIDEAVIDLTDTLCLFKGSVVDIGKEIKRRFRTEIGEWMRCSIGISTNRFLAKLAASLHKPDGLSAYALLIGKRTRSGLYSPGLRRIRSG